jgi:hypothetical protein
VILKRETIARPHVLPLIAKHNFLLSSLTVMVAQPTLFKRNSIAFAKKSPRPVQGLRVRHGLIVASL